MGKAQILLNSGQTLICERGESLDDTEAADALLFEVIQKQMLGEPSPFIRCENGGGFDARLVTGVTAAPVPKPPEVTEGTEEAQ
jgi:hypothetical protein